MNTALGCLLPLLLCTPLLSSQEQEQEPEGWPVQEQFEELDARGDLDGIVELWRANPGEVLYVIDSYLEGSLALWEAEQPADPEEIQALHQRALRGALAADRAFERAIFSDYASAFIGWNSAQKKQFRAGQKAYRAAREAQQAGEWERVLAESRRCQELAEPLGDWWGTAMGLSGEGRALEELGRGEEALRAHARARLLNQQLGLVGSEYRDLRAMARLATELGRAARARVVLERALALAERLEDETGLAELRALSERLDGR